MINQNMIYCMQSEVLTMIEGLTAENYLEKRAEIVACNENPVGVILRENEHRLDSKLIKLKEEYYNSCKGDVPFDMPVLTDKRIHESGLYAFCSRLPKGSDLHVHDMAELPVDELIEVLCGRTDIYVNKNGALLYGPDGKAPDGYVLFKDALDTKTVTVQKLRKLWTVEGAKDDEDIWDYFENLFKLHSALSKNTDFIKEYYRHAFRYYCRHNVIHIEIHKLLNKDKELCVEQLLAIREAYYEIKKEYPDLCVSIIGAGLKNRNFSIENARECFLNTVYVKEKIKDCSDPEHTAEFVIGFDLVNEEDASRPLKEFAPMLMEVKEKYPTLELFVHGGESLNAESDNLIDAYMIGAKRVGHGMNLYRYPDLLKRYAESEICLEVCPISNQTLGYTQDVRLHPAMEFIKRGVAVTLCSDDPAYQEHETLTDDFFAAIASWNLSVADIKQLAINSIMYSGVDAYQRKKLLQAFNAQWKEFVDEMIKE